MASLVLLTINLPKYLKYSILNLEPILLWTYLHSPTPILLVQSTAPYITTYHTCYIIIYIL